MKTFDDHLIAISIYFCGQIIEFGKKKLVE